MTTSKELWFKSALCALVIAWFFFPKTATAQVAVYDPVLIAERAAAHATEMVQWVQSTSNQIEQIAQLANQIQQMEDYLRVFGDPEKVAELIEIDDEIAFFEDLADVEDLDDLRNIIGGADTATDWDWGGVFRTEGIFNDVNGIGEEIERNDEDYAQYDFFQQTVDQYQKDAEVTEERRRTIHDDIARSVEQMRQATTSSEVAKLKGVVEAQKALLDEERSRMAEAADRILIINATREAQAAKVEQAQRDELSSMIGPAADGDPNDLIERDRPKLKNYGKASTFNWGK